MQEFILMSIKTKYANQIFEGTKLYEYRRKSIGTKNIGKKIFIYSSEEAKQIIGYIIIDNIIEGNLEYILDYTNNKDNLDIINYFNNASNCYALKIDKVYKFSNPITLESIKRINNNFVIPQYYRYLKEDEVIYKILKDLLDKDKIECIK